MYTFKIKKVIKMNKILIILIVLILVFKISKELKKNIIRATHLKAGKRWDEIVKELSQRKQNL